LAFTGGKSPFTWSLQSGNLPNGLNLNGNTISGTPTASGTFSFTVGVADSGNPQRTATKNLSITVTGVGALPSAPRTLTAKALKKGIQVGWKAPSSTGGSSIVEYRIYRGTTAGGEGPAPIGSSTSPNFTDNTTAAGTRYYYVVTAVNGSGEGPPSNEANAVAK
jgi:predicted phage tail protein